MQYSSFKRVYDRGAFVASDDFDQSWRDYTKCSIVEAVKEFGNLNAYVAQCIDVLDNPSWYFDADE